MAEVNINTTIQSILLGDQEIYKGIEDFDPLKEIATTPREILAPLYRKFGFAKMTDEEADQMSQLIVDYYNNKSIKIYPRMPKSAQKRIKQINQTMMYQGIRQVNIEDTARVVLDQFVNDSAMDAVMAKIAKEQAKMTTQIYNDTDKIFKEVFAQEKELTEEDPKVGKKVHQVKEAFDKATGFDLQMEYLKNDRPKNVKRYHQHYNGEIEEFNKKANSGRLSVARLDFLAQLLRVRLPKEKKYTTDEIKAFITLLARSLKDLDYTELSNIAYTHRLIDSMMRFYYKYQASEGDDAIFLKAAEVIDEIRKIITNYNPKGNKDKKK